MLEIVGLIVMGAVAVGGWCMALWQGRLRRKAEGKLQFQSHELELRAWVLERRYQAYDSFLRVISGSTLDFWTGPAHVDANRIISDPGSTGKEKTRVAVDVCLHANKAMHTVNRELGPLRLVASAEVLSISHSASSALNDAVARNERRILQLTAGGPTPDDEESDTDGSAGRIAGEFSKLRRQMREEMGEWADVRGSATNPKNG